MNKEITSFQDVQCLEFEVDYHSEDGESVCGSAILRDRTEGLFKEGDTLSILGAIFTCFHIELEETEWNYFFSLNTKYNVQV